MADKHNKLREDINKTLQSFTSISLHDASIALLKTLGYKSDKTIVVPDSDPNAFLELLSEHNSGVAIDKEKALFSDWKKADILFQLTDEELSTQQTSLFKNDSVNSGLLQSYLFFAIELTQRDYARGKLTAIARQLNRVFPMPVMVFIKHRDLLSIAVINRRINKRDNEKDVLGKVTIIRDISLSDPHRGHLDILDSFAFSSLITKTPIHNFDTLHAVWEEVFNVELLNNKFYKEIANWYFWAMQCAHFPFDSAEVDRDLFSSKEEVREHDAKNLIRLLTRLLFVWFLKEKDLIPQSLFSKEQLANKLLKNFDPDSRNTIFYKAILQNLFFASLNQVCGKRQFRNEGRQHRNITTLMRYEKYFKNPNHFIAIVESVVPFMNGGLFECLDVPHPSKKGPQGGEVIVFEDGFSDRDDNVLCMPDFLFFGEERSVDLSNAYGDNRWKQEKVRGIIHILNNYKFTVVENTPIDQEIALDPELLGKVFENLLASYNPETKTTARKQTGSFYTPRTIVDYMVDESLKVYLGKALCEASPGVTIEDANEGLDILFSYTEKEHAFSDAERQALIVAIDKCKILDPACGSGAFPMGVLHKLEFILGKLDTNNHLWRDRQIGKVDDTINVAERIDDITIREKTIDELHRQKQDIDAAFSNNDLGYGRKLYLIENCIYGVDIQPIATQVSKLRFFISLLVEQRSDSEKDNFGIRPLPNLETKFTTADTLIQIDKTGEQIELAESEKIKAYKKELRQVRHNLFNAKTPKTKKKYRNRDEKLREQIAIELEKAGWNSATAQQLSQWDPYDQNGSAPFFDPEWMYGITDGFDVVIGNPPYVQIQNFSGQKCQENWQQQDYKTFVKTGDIYCLFYERGFELLRSGGVLSYITSNKWMRAGYGKAMRKFFLENGHMNQLIDFGDSPIFKAATTYTNILLWSKKKDSTPTTVYDLNKVYADGATLDEMLCSAGADEPLFSEHSFVIAGKDQAFIKKRVEQIGTPLKDWDVSIYRGILTGCNEAFIISGEKKDELIAQDPKSVEIIKPILRGRDIKRYQEHYEDLWLINSHNGYTDSNGNRVPRVDIPNDYPAIWVHLQRINDQLNGRVENRSDQGAHWSNLRNCAYLEEIREDKILYSEIVYDSAFFYDTRSFHPEATIFMMTGENLKYLTALLNSKLLTYAFKMFYAGGDLRGNTFRYKKVFLNQLPVPRIGKVEQQSFEVLVDCVLLARANEMKYEAEQIEDVIDGLVYDLYFAEEMKKANCYTTDRISEIVKPFKETDGDDYKQEYIQTLCEFFRNDKIIRHSLVHRRTVRPVEIVLGAKDE